MKLFLVLAAAVGCLALAAGCNSFDARSGTASLVFDGRTPQKEYVLSKDAKNPKKAAAVPFNHENHSTKNYNVEGTGPIACIECHHTDQPAAEAAKHPPLKTADPADRTTTLTAETITDAKTPPVRGCRDCHAQEGDKPKFGDAIPEVTYEGDTDPTVLTNEEAYHRNCNTCHDAATQQRKLTTAPTGNECLKCHSGK